MSIPVGSDLIRNAVSAFAAGGGGGVVDPWLYAVLGADVTNSTVTLVNVTGLLLPVEANTTYEIEISGAFTAAAATTGFGVAVDIPSGSVVGQMVHPISQTAAGSTMQNADAAVGGATSGVPTLGANIPFSYKGIVAVGATAGNVQVMCRSEIAASAVTVKANLTVMKMRKAAAVVPALAIVRLTQAAYDALTTPNPNTLYVIVPTGSSINLYQWVETTAAAYAALPTKDPETLYVVNG